MKLLRWLPALAWTIGTLLVLLTPGIEVPKTFLGDLTDKAGHAAMFAFGTLFWFLPQILSARYVDFGQLSSRYTTIGLLLFGIGTEIGQRLVPGRSAALEDFIADAIGIAAGISTIYGFNRWQSRRKLVNDIP